VLIATAAAAHAHVQEYLRYFSVERSIAVNTEEIRVTHDCTLSPTSSTLEAGALSPDAQRVAAELCVQAAQYLAEDLLIVQNGRVYQAVQEVFRVDEGTTTTTFRSEIAAPLEETSGTLSVIDPAFLLPSIGGGIPSPTEVYFSSGTRHVRSGKQHTVPSVPLLSLQLTSPTSGTLTLVVNDDELR